MTTVEKRADELIRRLTEDDDTEHLDYEALAAYVDGNKSPEARQHLATCPACAEDLRDLRSAATTSPLSWRKSGDWRRRTPKWAAVAAAALVAVLLFSFYQSKPALDVRDAAATMALAPADAAAAHAALDRGTIEISPAALALRGPKETLMGSAPAKYDVLTPVATFVRETRPRFAWTTLAEARQYRVEIYDDAHNLVLASPNIAATSWTPDRDLARGRAYVWQVVADDRTPAPAPPAPPARFGILGADAVARIDAAAQRYRGSHLMLAIAAAREGALDDARAELAVLQTMNPRSSAVARLVRALGPK